MVFIIQRFLRIFRPPQPVPDAYRKIFQHLYLDIGWFGVVSGTTIAFLAVFATRQGASTQQIGLLSAAPALINLIFALPAGSWLSKRPIGRAVFWTSVLTRVFYLLLVPLPVLFVPEAQVRLIILMTLLMTIPGTALVVGFNSLFGEAVPMEWRGHVVGIRNAIVSVVSTVFTLLSGVILDRVAFPIGYQIVFGLGVVGAIMSSLHLYLLSSSIGNRQQQVVGERRNPERRSLAEDMRGLYRRGMDSLRLDVMRGSFAKLMTLLFVWHLVQFMTIPVVTPYIVNDLQLSDQWIGLAAGLFNMTVFIGSLQLNQATSRFGNRRLTGGGIMGLSLFPILTSLGAGGYIMGNVVGGLAWAMAGGALYNYILENVPGNDRPAYLAWYSLVSNAAILIGSTAGPMIAGIIGFQVALLVFGIGRFLAGAALMRWG